MHYKMFPYMTKIAAKYGQLEIIKELEKMALNGINNKQDCLMRANKYPEIMKRIKLQKD